MNASLANPQPSRAEILRANLCTIVIVPESLNQTRTQEVFQALAPQNPFHAFLAADVAQLTVRIERARSIERRERDKIMLRAEISWDEDRKLDANRLGETLSKNPAEVVHQLRQTPHGCDWMISRWGMLAFAANLSGGGWTPEQTEIAFDLLATPKEFRQPLDPGITLDSDGELLDAPSPADLARREIASLKKRRELVTGLDESNRALAKADLFEGKNEEIRQIRRHEAELQRRLRWCLSQLKSQPAHEAPAPGLTARWMAKPEPAKPMASPPAPTFSPVESSRLTPMLKPEDPRGIRSNR